MATNKFHVEYDYDKQDDPHIVTAWLNIGTDGTITSGGITNPEMSSNQSADTFPKVGDTIEFDMTWYPYSTDNIDPTKQGQRIEFWRGFPVSNNNITFFIEPNDYQVFWNNIKDKKIFELTIDKVTITTSATVDLHGIVNIPKKHLSIDGKQVKSMSIGNDITSINMGIHTYTFESNIDVTEDEVKAHVLAHTTWATTATIADAKLKGLTVQYSKSTGITDGESISATVVYDSSISDTLNGGTANFVVSNIVVANPDRTITEADVTSYVDANINWSGTSGNLDVTKWAALHPGTKLYIADLHMVSGTEYTFTVQADHGYTVNGGASFDVKHTVTHIKLNKLYVVKTSSIKKINDDDTVETFVSGPYYSIIQNKANNIYAIKGGYEGIERYKNGRLTSIGGRISTNNGFLWEDSNGITYIGGEQNLYTVVGDTITIVHGVTRANNSSMYETKNGDVYFMSSSGLYKRQTDMTFNKIKSGNFGYSFMYETSTNIIYVGNSNGIWLFENDTLPSSPITNTNVSNGFMFEHENGTIYVGTNNDGIKKFVNNNLVDWITTGYRIMKSLSDGVYLTGVNTGSIASIDKLIDDKIVTYISAERNIIILDEFDLDNIV